jgi:hypothetical protein
MKIVGIDPGVQPTLACLHDNNEVIFEDETCVTVKRGKSLKREPEPRVICRILKIWHPDLVIIERVGGRPGESISAVASFMRALGILQGICCGMTLPFEMVEPSRWTRDMRVKKGEDAGRARALELFPHLTEDLHRKKDHNRADAAMLALWGRQFVVPNHPLFS